MIHFQRGTKFLKVLFLMKEYIKIIFQRMHANQA